MRLSVEETAAVAAEWFGQARIVPGFCESFVCVPGVVSNDDDWDRLVGFQEAMAVAGVEALAPVVIAGPGSWCRLSQGQVL